MVTKETNGAFLFGYLVGVAGKLLPGKGVLGLSEGLWHPLHCSCILVSFAAGKRKEIPVWMLGEAGSLL